MKTIITILLLSISLSLSAQNLAADIEKQYSLLDKDEYLKVLVENYRVQRQNFHYNERKQHEKFCKEHGMELAGKDTCGLADKEAEDFAKLLQQPNPYFILKLKYCQNGFIVDTSQLRYDLFWHSGRTIQYVMINCGVIETQNFYFFTSKKSIAQRERIARSKIMKMNPNHLLSCDAVSGMLYCLDNTIMVYSIGDDKFYQLDEYLKLFLEKILISNKDANKPSGYSDMYLKRFEK